MSFRRHSNVGLFLAALAVIAAPAAATQYVSVAAGNWSAPATWGAAGYPQTAADSVTISHTVTLDLSPAGAVAAVTIGPGGTLACSGAWTLQVNGDWVNNGSAALTNGTVALAGPGAAQIGGTAPTSFRVLQIAKSAYVTVTMNQNVTAAASPTGLYIDRGRLLTNGYNLTVPNMTISTAGGLVGTLDITGSSVVNLGSIRQDNVGVDSVKIGAGPSSPQVTISGSHVQWNFGQIMKMWGGTLTYTGTGASTNLMLSSNNTNWGCYIYGGTVNFYGSTWFQSSSFFVCSPGVTVNYLGSAASTAKFDMYASGSGINYNHLVIAKSANGVTFTNTPGNTILFSVFASDGVQVESPATLTLVGDAFQAGLGYDFAGDFVNNGTVTVNANLYLSGSASGSGTWRYNSPGTGTSRVTFKTTGIDSFSSGTASFYDVVVSKPAGGLGLLSDAAVEHSLNVTGGALVVGKSALTLGTTSASAGVTVATGAGFAAIGVGDTLAAVGAAGPAWPYSLAVQAGGTIGGYRAGFSGMDTLGIRVAAGAFVDTLYNFSSCSFDHGSLPGPMLSIENGQALTMLGTSFAGLAGANVEKLANTGHVTVIGGAGNRWGEDFDSDPNNIVDWYTADVGCAAILAPAGTIGVGTAAAPRVVLQNWGDLAVATAVRLAIRDSLGAAVYDTTETGIALAVGDSIVHDFSKTWVAAPEGDYSVQAWTEYAGDANPANDTATGACAVIGRDVGIAAIVAPAGVVGVGVTVTPTVRIGNFGPVDVLTGVRLVLRDSAGTAVYDTTDEDVAVAAGQMVDHAFSATWLATPRGRYSATAWTTILDINPANDTGTSTFRVGEPVTPGWSEVTQVPLAPSGRAVKDGGWITWDALTQQHYVAKAYKTSDFYSYEPISGTWGDLPSWPLGVEAKPPYKGANGVSDGNGTIYATKGNNKTGFWKYTTADSTWTQLTDVPLGLSNKKVKGGTDMVYVQDDTTGWVYLLKGYKTEFYRYNTVTNQWQTLAEAPTGVKAKYDKGSWLLYDEASARVYAHKAKYHELYAYSLDSLSWGPLQPGMPLVNNQTGKSKKSKDGGDAVLIDGVVYALKGGNTIDFYALDLATMTWAERETIPSVGTTGKKKRVKGGGSMATDGVAVTALKGNKTLEVWRYVPTAQYAGRPTQHARAAGQGNCRLQIGDCSLQIVRNPAVGAATVRWSGMPADRPSVLTIYDAVGRSVLTRPLSRTVAGSLELRGLPAGVYLLRVSGGLSATRKLVIE
jgi:hypothetical protein